jgi:hypothetical protein
MMTKDKAQKRAVRARMDKTGERYATARLHLLDLHRADGDATDGEGDASAEAAVDLFPGQTAEFLASDAPALPPWVAEPGFSDAAIRKATGKSWDEWFALLDAWGGASHAHPEIARHVAEAHGVDGWWAQSVTVGYERARGMRALHERPDGFSMSASKTFPVPVERLFAAFVEPEERARWLEAVELRNRTSQPHKSARFDVLPGETRLALFFAAKGPQKSTAQLNQERLADAEEVARWKTLWKGQLAFLADYLASDDAAY